MVSYAAGTYSAPICDNFGATLFISIKIHLFHTLVADRHGQTEKNNDNRCSKKSAFVTKAARNVQFFALIRSLFPEYKFKIFLKKYVIKQSFPRLKEQHLIGKLRFCPGFC